MDIETILTAVASAASVAAAVGYSIKRIVDRSIDTKCSRIAERALVEIREEARRRLTSLDYRIEVFKTTLSLTDRARKCCRDLQNVLDTGIINSERLNQMHRLKNYTDTILDILLNEKAYISPKICAMAQEVKNLLQEYPWNTETFLRSWRQNSGTPLMESALGSLKGKVAECHRRIDDLYDLIREEIQHQMEEIAENTALEKRAIS
ncbi:MAG: hypothetical protein JW902_04580 [Syntrophaceae bacterium]|nr:hypothetical protein [Syntrophaceae bacterium]